MSFVLKLIEQRIKNAHMFAEVCIEENKGLKIRINTNQAELLTLQKELIELESAKKLLQKKDKKKNENVRVN